VIASDIKI